MPQQPLLLAEAPNPPQTRSLLARWPPLPRPPPLPSLFYWRRCRRPHRYLRSKQLKKKQGNRGTGGAPVVEKELKLRDKVAFGEVVHAPLEMQVRGSTTHLLALPALGARAAQQQQHPDQSRKARYIHRPTGRWQGARWQNTMARE